MTYRSFTLALCLSAVASVAMAQEARRGYIIQLADDPAASYNGGVSGLTATRPAAGQRFNVTVEVDLFDSAGKKIGTAKDYKDAVEPRGEWTFRALLLQTAVVTARVATVREQQ